MRRRLFSFVPLLGLLVLAACASAKEATPAPAGPTSAARAPWEQEWERTLAAAKQEGNVTVITSVRGGPGQKALTEPFQKKYGITVEYFGAGGGEAATRIKTERAAGQYLWDIYVGGHQTMVGDLKPVGVFDPIEPALILPEVKEPKNWLAGGLSFVDKDHMALLMISYSGTPGWINTSMVKPDEIKSFKDLLDPKWKGKIVATDPRVAGPGQATFSFFYAHKDLGPDFIRALARQEIVFLRDYAQPPGMLAQGKYPICLACSDTDSKPLKEQGLPIQPFDPQKVREGGYLSGGNGVLGLFNKAPHPNAARVYINWLLSKEGQTELAKSQGYASRRVDIPNKDWTAAELLPDLRFWNAYTEEGIEVREKLLPLLRDVLGQ
ncbi:MAG TPA: extracellular solute-binding protein [Dehalococcoidia bacterium]|nr:extracellular solute-binding protein [Dehalococcoidia bacterium]